MASADVRDDLLCPICLSTFTDPVILTCGHNFCRGCIDQFLNIQDEFGVYSCPQCREKFPQRPSLIRNIALHNVAERFVEEPPAVKCSIHEKILEYYCTEDAACICVYCSAEEHRQHLVEKVEEASEKKKEILRNVLKKLNTNREKTEERVQSVRQQRRKALKKTSEETKRVTALFRDIRRRLEDLKKRILSDISRQEKQLSLSLSDVIQKLEIKRDELSRKMRHIEELCKMADPLTVLQDPDTGDLCGTEEEGGDEDTGGHDTTHDVDMDVITKMLDKGFSDIVTYLQSIKTAKPKAMRRQPLLQMPAPSARSLTSLLTLSQVPPSSTWSLSPPPPSCARSLPPPLKQAPPSCAWSDTTKTLPGPLVSTTLSPQAPPTNTQSLRSRIQALHYRDNVTLRTKWK